eukprot:PhF_6_TR29320/c0_g1_i1/m.43020
MSFRSEFTSQLSMLHLSCAPWPQTLRNSSQATITLSKKTEKTTSIALVTLMGAACMNNTMCLAVFLVIIIAKDLKWVFAAETMVIFLVEIGLCVVAHVRIQHWWMSLVVMSFLPLSLIFVAVLEEAGGLN